jgi:hypothetical protein
MYATPVYPEILNESRSVAAMDTENELEQVVDPLPPVQYIAKASF